MYHYNVASFFSEVASSNADRPALRYPDQIYTYSDLDEWVESLAMLLLCKGCRRGDVIAIGHTKQPLSYALMLAALRLGIGYVNLDVTSPKARTSLILERSNPAILFYDDLQHASVIEELAQARGCDAILLDFEILPAVSPSDRVFRCQMMRLVDGACIAYIMFTSGSTGIPKGVAVTHQNVLHFISWGQQYFQVTNHDNLANLSPMYFDNSVFDFYIGLFSGASLSPIHRHLLNSPYELLNHVKSMQCSIWFSVPSLLIYLMTMKALKAMLMPELRYIIFGGEGYPKTELIKLYDLYHKQAQLVNVYGPTECTCICSAYTLTDDDFQELEGLPTLGNLNQNFDYRILDEEENDSDCGELCLIGPNVAAGYFNDLDRSATSFITLTDSARFMKRMYKTGDLVRESKGRLYFVGRKDNQVKHMGYRIELEEIEHALVSLPQIDQAAVLYQRHSTVYGKIIAFVASQSSVTEKELLSALAELLPDYMLPSRMIIDTALPKNANGKIDRQKLYELVQ